MLKISKPLSAGKVGTYYEKEYISHSEAYYSQEGQLRGEWHGKLAETFQLSGPVGKLEFDRLAEGQDPHTGKQIIEHRDTIKTKNGEEVGHRAAWDLTFGAPKTVSLTALVGGDERVRDAHRAAVRTALDATERYVQARIGGNNTPETTGKWAAAIFEHDTARPVDGYPAPHLHTHVVMFNMTMADKIRSLDTKELFRVQSMSTAIYQAELASRLKILGYDLEHGKNFAVEIKGYTQEYRDAASARSFQITEEMQEKGISGAEAAERIAHQTREGKQVWNAEELKAAHRAEAEKYGNQPDHVVETAKSRLVQEEVSQAGVSRVAHEAISHARNRLIERNAVFDHYEVIRDGLRFGMGTLRLADVEQALDRRLKETEEFIYVSHHRADAPGARFTTPEMIEMERRTIETVRQGIGQHQPLGRTLNKDDFDAAYRERLNDGQKEMVWNVLQSRDRVVGVQGGAGTGKRLHSNRYASWPKPRAMRRVASPPHPAPLNPSKMRDSSPKHSRRISCGRRSIMKIGLVCTFWMNPVSPQPNKFLSFFPASVATTVFS
jgi:conjugative relaxase-like TrwC/TraI family protein